MCLDPVIKVVLFPDSLFLQRDHGNDQLTLTPPRKMLPSCGKRATWIYTIKCWAWGEQGEERGGFQGLGVKEELFQGVEERHT